MRHAIIPVLLSGALAACASPAGTEQRVAHVSAASASSGASFTVVASGDVLLHLSVNDQAKRDARGRGHDFRPMFASIKPVVQAADLAICHLEVPIAPRGGPFLGYPLFSGPPQVATALADLGYDTCSTASNHSLDTGAVGVRRTLNALDRAGVRHAGSARSADEARRITMLDARGVKVAHLSYTYGFNGFRLPSDKPWLANRISKRRILADARRAKSDGAQVVIVSLHWGKEYQHEPTAAQVSLGRALLAAKEIDLIVGHHVHVVQPFGRSPAGKWVAYGLGNLIANQGANAGPKHEGVIARFTFTRSGGGWRVSAAEFIPTFIQRSPVIRVHDLRRLLADQSYGSAGRRRFAKIMARTTRIVHGNGAPVTLAHR